MKELLVLLSFIFTIPVIGQVNFAYEPYPLQDFELLEDSLGSEKLGFVEVRVSENYFPTAKSGKFYYPLTYKRLNDDFYPTLQVQYFYNETDSTMLSTSYDWNMMDYVKNLKTGKKELKKQTKREKDYLAKYNAIKSELIGALGQPKYISEEETNAGHFYKLEWETEQNKVLLLFKFSKSLGTLPGGMVFGSFNIRVKVDYIN